MSSLEPYTKAGIRRGTFSNLTVSCSPTAGLPTPLKPSEAEPGTILQGGNAGSRRQTLSSAVGGAHPLVVALLDISAVRRCSDPTLPEGAGIWIGLYSDPMVS